MTRVRLLLLLCLLTVPPAQAGKLTGGDNGDAAALLPAGEAFILGTERQADDSLVLHWTIAPGYYLYRDRMEFELVDAGGARLGEPRFAPAEIKQDPFFGETAVYYDEASVRLPLAGEPEPGAVLRLTWQGCNEPRGVCYPPVEENLDIGGFTLAGGPPPDVSEQGRIAAALADSGLAWTVLAFIGFGLLLTFFSSFGQTFFIALFSDGIRTDLGLSHGGFGMLYSLATLASAGCLMWLGRKLDELDLRLYAALVCAGLAGACFLMGSVNSVPLLALALLALRGRRHAIRQESS
jgi:hypothetical protein